MTDGQLDLFALADASPVAPGPELPAHAVLWAERRDARRRVVEEVAQLDCCTGRPLATVEGWEIPVGAVALRRCGRCEGIVDKESSPWFSHDQWAWGCLPDRTGATVVGGGDNRPISWDGLPLDPDLGRHDRIHWEACRRCKHSFAMHHPQGMPWPEHPGQSCRRCDYDRVAGRWDLKGGWRCGKYVGGPYGGNPDRRVQVLRASLAAVGIELEEWN